MGDDSFISILFFGAVAVFLAHRLWQVLGRRDGEAPPASPDQLMARGALATPVDRIVPVAQKPIIVAPGDPVSLEGAIAQIKQADPSFEERAFVSGAIAAFKMIVTDFAKGDRTALKPFLSDVVYGSFDQAIREREASGQIQEITIPRVTADIETAALKGDMAEIVMAFRSGQTNVIRGQDGTIIDGDPKRIEDVLDIWTFRRDVKSRDPNWILVETRHQG